jgi:hypothetical protein
MSFDEKEARNIINILLQEDIVKNKRWLNEINKFSSDEIKNLIEGTIDFSYPVSNKESFKKLVYKFNNYSDFILEWYQNKENHKYLIELWKHYVCIEDIKENIKNDEELTKFLESKSIHYSKWPNEIKEQFKSIFDETDGTFIYKIKEELNRNPQIKKIINDLNKNREQCKNIGVNANIKVQRKYEEANDCTLTSIIMGVVSLALSVRLNLNFTVVVLKGKHVLIYVKRMTC